ADDDRAGERPAGQAAAAEIAQADPAAPAAEDADEVPRPETPTLVTLGSMDPASGYAMLVTLNTRGGGVERLELTERKADGRLKYRRVDVQSGYLGYLAAVTHSNNLGCVVRVVGP